jgi:DNA-binding protein HU-beta
VNRAEFVDAVATRTGLSATDTDKALTGILDQFAEVVSGDDKLTISGWLTVSRGHRAAREGRNPSTGETIQIPATNVAKISAGKKLKDAANS